MAIEKEHPVEKLIILQLIKDGSYKLYELEIQDELANACLALHQALKRKNAQERKKKND